MWLAPCVGGSSQTQKMLSACPMKALTDRSEAHAPQNLSHFGVVVISSIMPYRWETLPKLTYLIYGYTAL